MNGLLIIWNEVSDVFWEKLDPQQGLCPCYVKNTVIINEPQLVFNFYRQSDE